MRDILAAVMTAWRSGAVSGLATVVSTYDSAPMPVGSAMLVTANGAALGSVSGGCVEGAVYDLATEVTDTGQPVLVRYGISDDDAFAVGLTCGGVLDVFVEPLSRATFAELDEVSRDESRGNPVGVATIIEHPDPARLGRHLLVRATGSQGDLGTERSTAAVDDDARGLLAVGRSGLLQYGPDGERLGVGMRVFVQSFAPQPRLLVFGAVDFAAALARLGSYLGYRVTVCDARAVFATTARFAHADDVVVAWPHRYLAEQIDAGLIDARTVICVLTHDPKFDIPLLEVALRGPALAYIGAMGSRRTHEQRNARLRDAGVTDEQLGVLHSPLGLDIGGRTPEETAVSIMAEVIAQRWGGSGLPLGDISRRIHPES
ncbi:MAG: XdhC/CoxI family protein [Cryobacterium sp.]